MTTEKNTVESLARDAPTPVIPDGGLGDALPEWLRTTPSWTKAPDALRTIPEPDTSEIDPASLVTIDDLPGWLQAVAARSASSRETAEVGEPTVATAPVVEPTVSASETPRIDAMIATSRAATAQEFDGQVESDVLIDTSERGESAPIGRVGRFQVSEGVVIFLLAVVGVLALACLILLMSLTFR